MPSQARFDLIFAPEALNHLVGIERKYHRLIEKTIDRPLTFAPERETRNRKLLEQPAPYDATWELRFGPNNGFRAFYEVDSEAYAVWVLAIGVKAGNRLLIGREEFEL